MHLTDKTEKQLSDWIIENKFKPGDLLPKETELAEMLGVSRAIIREVLSRFRMMGIIESKRRRGMIITNPKILNGMNLAVSSGFIEIDTRKDLLELRLMLEMGLSEFLIHNTSEADIKKLRHIIKEEEKTEDIRRLIALDIEFHACLYEITGNTTLMQFQSLLEPVFGSYKPRPADWREREEIGHADILHEIIHGDPESYRKVMKMHLQKHFDQLLTDADYE